MNSKMDEGIVDLDILENKIHSRVLRRKELNSLVLETSNALHGLSSRTIELNRTMRNPRLIHRRKKHKGELFLAVDALSRQGTTLSAQHHVLDAEDSSIKSLSEDFYLGCSGKAITPEDRLRTILGEDFSVTLSESGVIVAARTECRRPSSEKSLKELLVDVSLAEELYDSFNSLGYWISREIATAPAVAAGLFKVVLETAQEFRLAVILANSSN